MTKIETDLEINDRVEIIEIGRTGVVTSFEWDGVHLSIRVRYFDNCNPVITVFYRDELRKVNDDA